MRTGQDSLQTRLRSHPPPLRSGPRPPSSCSGHSPLSGPQNPPLAWSPPPTGMPRQERPSSESQVQCPPSHPECRLPPSSTGCAREVEALARSAPGSRPVGRTGSQRGRGRGRGSRTGYSRNPASQLLCPSPPRAPRSGHFCVPVSKTKAGACREPSKRPDPGGPCSVVSGPHSREGDPAEDRGRAAAAWGQNRGPSRSQSPLLPRPGRRPTD